MQQWQADIATTKRWLAFYVSSRTEKKICELLQQKGIEAYTPIIKTMRQWSDRKKLVELPLISGYVFARISPKEQDTAVQTRGIVNFVRLSGQLAVIRDEEIENLKQLIQLGYHIESNPIKHNFKEGEKVKIKSGPLKNIEGFVLENKEGRFIELVLESIGQSLRVKLPKEILLPL